MIMYLKREVLSNAWYLRGRWPSGQSIGLRHWGREFEARMGHKFDLKKA